MNDWAGPSSSSRLLSNSTRGLCGLNNLGNTCFMNSALQCLSNVPPLTKYFLSGKYKDEINNVNPLGMGGELAVAYADVIRNLWSGKAASFVPTKFKRILFQCTQDAQELMAFLLDGLHEDLNRIKRKPYVEAKEMENEADEILAENAWRYYKMRNDSIITDLFNGLLKSTVICPECHKVSITFDPFGVLSLPLPEKPDRQIPVLFVPLDPNHASDSVSRGALSLSNGLSYCPFDRYCPRCKKHQQATKKFDLWSLPEVLVIHLKRFSSCRNYRSKIETLISFPISVPYWFPSRNMVMSKWVINPKSASFTYNLVSVCNHDGGLGAGHCKGAILPLKVMQSFVILFFRYRFRAQLFAKQVVRIQRFACAFNK
ncbi:UCH domain containing protein [Trichuris trichiura]|uniref:ubiquitinyl hydrolase 1 n=1 Tax=Trichuris trichiura TaxID=36087 RepID=A0A077Z2P4_TRITR|nr:UCH domain containing protein [Trichuris trichiura]